MLEINGRIEALQLIQVLAQALALHRLWHWQWKDWLREQKAINLEDYWMTDWRVCAPQGFQCHLFIIDEGMSRSLLAAHSSHISGLS